MRKRMLTTTRMAVSGLATFALLAACGGDDAESGADTTITVDTVAAPDSSPATDAPTPSTDSVPAGPVEGPLNGTFSIDPASCSDPAAISGSYFRMIQGGGTLTDGPFVPNADSTCADQAFSALLPGSAGLVVGEFQPQPDAPFDAVGNGLADAIVAPVKFFGANFAVSTNEVDPASGTSVVAPSIVLNADGTLNGNLSAFSVAWNGQQFNQGSPKPDGSRPGLTGEVSGTLDPATGRYVIEWVSQIVGGPFDGFTGVWHLEGVFAAS